VDVRGYLDALTLRLRAVLGSELVAASLVGSAGAGWFEPEASDLDVVAVVRHPLDAAAATTLARQVGHANLPCPARRLELVVYRRAVLRDPGTQVPFELNFNTGPGIADHVGRDPGAEASHWFLLDLSMARERSWPLHGPPLRSLLGEIPRSAVIDALRTSLDWFRLHEPDRSATILAACRAWRYAEEGEWASKREAAEWAAPQLSESACVHQALSVWAGDGGPQPGEDAVAEVYERSRTALDAAA
jgi:Domain of unknown function (DUF4111)